MKVVPINEENGRLEDFDLFWSTYPRKLAKKDAQLAWKQTKKIRPPIEQVIAAVHKMTELSTDAEFLPYAGSWLRGQRWEDQ